MEASGFQYENYLNIHEVDDFGTCTVSFSLRFRGYDCLTENCLIMHEDKEYGLDFRACK